MHSESHAAAGRLPVCGFNVLAKTAAQDVEFDAFGAEISHLLVSSIDGGAYRL